MADSYAKVASCLEKSATQETERDMQRLLARGSDLFEKLKKLEVGSLSLSTMLFHIEYHQLNMP